MKDIFENKFLDQKELLRKNFLPVILPFYSEHQLEIDKLTKNIIGAARSYESHNHFEKLISTITAVDVAVTTILSSCFK